MYDFIFNEEQNKEKKRLFVRGFSENYSRMIYSVLCDGFQPCENDPHLIISEKDDFSGEENCPIIIIGAPAAKKKNRENLSRPVDLKELRRLAFELTKEKETAEKKLQQINGKLSNPGFLAKAPANVIETQKADAEKLTEKIKMIDESLAALQ